MSAADIVSRSNVQTHASSSGQLRPGRVYSTLSTTTTMKIYSLAVILAPPSGPSATLCHATDLSSFSFYQKGSVGEFMTFFTKTVAERTSQGARQSVQENNYTAHVYNRGGAEQLAGRLLLSIALYKVTHSYCSRDHHRPRVPCPTGLLPSHQAPRRFHSEDPTIFLFQTFLNLVPRDQYLPSEVPRPATCR